MTVPLDSAPVPYGSVPIAVMTPDSADVTIQQRTVGVVSQIIAASAQSVSGQLKKTSHSIIDAST